MSLAKLACLRCGAEQNLDLRRATRACSTCAWGRERRQFRPCAGRCNAPSRGASQGMLNDKTGRSDVAIALIIGIFRRQHQTRDDQEPPPIRKKSEAAPTANATAAVTRHILR